MAVKIARLWSVRLGALLGADWAAARLAAAAAAAAAAATDDDDADECEDRAELVVGGAWCCCCWCCTAAIKELAAIVMGELAVVSSGLEFSVCDVAV